MLPRPRQRTTPSHSVSRGSRGVDDCWVITEQSARPQRETVAEEVPVALIYNGNSFAVMLATPADLDDFARGFSLTEGIVGSLSDIEAIETAPVSRGIEVRLTIDVGWANALAARRRNLAGRTGCGLCGADKFSDALRPIAPVKAPLAVTSAAIRRATVQLPLLQALNAEVGALHAAAFVAADGNIVMLREDIGRHNALDKLIGALAVAGTDRSKGFVLVSSRCSYEMVHKTAAAGIGLIAAVSAPTSLAIELATNLNVALLGFARDGRFTVYACPARIAETRCVPSVA